MSVELAELANQPDRLERWLSREEAADDDFLGHGRVAQRLARRLVERGGSFGLVGAFGSGKSSLVNRLELEVGKLHQTGQTEVWFCVCSCWGFEDSGAAVHHILGRAVEEVGRRADAFTLRSLPEGYRKTFSAGGDWLRTVSDLLLGSSDSHDQFRPLATVLEAVNARLVFVIEDLDRTTAGRFNRQEVLALLQRLREHRRFSFILAAGYSEYQDIDFAKLCDHIEVLREVEPDAALAIIRAVRALCLRTANEVPSASIPEDTWRFNSGFLSRRDILIPSMEAVALLVRTPRALKHALRYTSEVWRHLRGEVDLDHLLVVNVLRHSAPPAFDFLLRHRTQLATSPQEHAIGETALERIRTRLQEEWREATANVEWDRRVAQTVIEFLLPTAPTYLGSNNSGIIERQWQGIAEERYWLRIVNEEVPPGETPDQTVIRDFEQWRTGGGPNSPLIIGLLASPSYLTTWRHVERSVLPRETAMLLRLAGDLLAGPRAKNCEVAALAIRGAIEQTQLDPDQTTLWLEERIRSALPVDLALVNDLYYCFTGTHRKLVQGEYRNRVRRLIHQLSQTQFRSSGELIRACPAGVPHDLYRLVFPPSEPSECSGLEHWRWLGPTMLASLWTERALFAPRIAGLIMSNERREPWRNNRATANSELLFGFFGTDAAEVVRLLAQEWDSSPTAEREFISQVVESAQQLLMAATPPAMPSTGPGS